MTTISSTGASTPTATPAATTPAPAASPAAPAKYDGAAAVAKAQALATDRINSGASGSNGGLLGLSHDILSLLQGGSGTNAISTLFGGSDGNAFFGVQSLTALYGAQQARAKASTALSPIDRLIAANNAVLNANTTATLAASGVKTPPAATPPATGTTTTS